MTAVPGPPYQDELPEPLLAPDTAHGTLLIDRTDAG